jgi:hypothetical protein
VVVRLLRLITARVLEWLALLSGSTTVLIDELLLRHEGSSNLTGVEPGRLKFSMA